MNTNVHSPIRYFGGKYYLAKDIIPLIPQHHCYVEPFGGGGHTLTRKQESKVEIYNDIDHDIVNFFMTLRKDKGRLIEALETLPTSRYLYDIWSKEELPSDPFERAVRWYYLLRHCMIPTPNKRTGWRHGKIKNSAFDYQNSVERLNAFAERFRNVVIECLDYKEILLKYDSPNTFYFIDPPYVGREDQYKGNFKEHRKLAEMLKKIKGKALVSYYNCPMLERYYEGWHKVEVEAVVGDGVKKKEFGEKRKTETETFFLNYNPIESNEMIPLF